MKTIKLLLLITVMLAGINLQAQHRGMKGPKGKKGPNYEKIMEKKMIFMKENLMLSPKESQAFEAAYKRYIKEKMQIHQQMKNDFRLKIEKGQYLDMSDKEINQLIDRKMELENKNMQLEFNFQKELRRILPPKKVIKFYKAERGFNRKMMARMKKGRKMQQRKQKQQQKK